MKSALTPPTIIAVITLILIQTCGQQPPIPEPEGFDVKAGAPQLIRVNADEPLIQPYAPYIKLQVRYDDGPTYKQTVVYEIQDCNVNWLGERNDFTRSFNDLNPAGQIAPEEGFVVWDRAFGYQNLCSIPDRFQVSFAVPLSGEVPEGQKWGAAFEVTIIDDHEASDVPGDEFKHQRDLEGQEVLGDGFHDAGDPDYNPVYGDSLDPARKDLFIEFDIPISHDWLVPNLPSIISTLKTIFNTAGVNIHVFDGRIDIPEPLSSRNDMKAHLHNDRDPNLGRRALHVVVLNEEQGQPLKLGKCIQLQGNPPNGDGLWEYECFDEVYDTQRGSGGYGALDSVGCVIFWEVFDGTSLGPGWTTLDAFCRVLAHEIGHALGIYTTFERYEGGNFAGCIMSHDSRNHIDQQKQNHSMDFYKANVDNVVDGIEQPFSNAFNLRDIVGVNTTSIKSGNIFPDNINP